MVEETPIADQEIEDQSPDQVLENLQELIVEGKDENSGNQ
jgi:hypothetical protein